MDKSSDDCSKWKADGFKCVDANTCEDGYFDNSGGVPAIRGESEDYIDIDNVSITSLICKNNPIFYFLFKIESFFHQLRLIFNFSAIGIHMLKDWFCML